MSTITERGGRTSQRPERSCTGRGPRPGEREPEPTPILRLSARDRERLDAALRVYANADRTCERCEGTPAEKAAYDVFDAATRALVRLMAEIGVGSLDEVLSPRELKQLMA